jgi:hypothetical protein
MVTCGGVCKVPTRRPLGTRICCCLFSLHSFERQSTNYSVYRRPTRLSTNYQPYRGINVLIEADASFLKAMTNSPGLPNAAATWWIAYIQLFDLEFKHIPANSHKAPDGLSRCQHVEADMDNTEIENEDEREDGSFIRAQRPVNPPKAVPIEPSPADISYSSMTRLVARKGEPINVIRRQNGSSCEQLHLAYAKPDTDLARATCGFLIINVPTIGNTNEAFIGIIGLGEDSPSEERIDLSGQESSQQNISKAK